MATNQEPETMALEIPWETLVKMYLERRVAQHEMEKAGGAGGHLAYDFARYKLDGMEHILKMLPLSNQQVKELKRAAEERFNAEHPSQDD